MAQPEPPFRRLARTPTLWIVGAVARVLRRVVARPASRDGGGDRPLRVLGIARGRADPQRGDPRGRSSGPRRAHGRHGIRRHLHRRPCRRHRERASGGRRSRSTATSQKPNGLVQPPLLRPADPAPRRAPALDDESRPGRQRARDAVRSQPAQDRREGSAEDHVQGRRRRGRGDRGAGGGQGVPAAPVEVPGDGREDPARCPPVRSARHRQDPPREGGRGGGGRAVLLDQRVRLRRDVRRRRRRPGP